MLTVAIGHDTDYLTDAVAKGREGYYTGAVAAGEPAGLWYGAGAEKLGLSGEVDAEVMKALYTHGLDPRDPNTAQRATWGEAERLGNAPRNYKKADEIYAGLLEKNPDASPERRAELRAEAGRSARQSVAFYDAVLSAPKSLTVAWVAFERAATEARAAGDIEAAELWAWRARTVEESMLVGHGAVVDFLAEKAGFARAGHHGGGGGQWVDSHGLVAAQFLQHDSRDKDPQLHVHGAILNRAECDDGKWRAVDGTLITQWKAGASAVGIRTAEAHAWQTLGARWEVRPDGKAREVVGVDAESMGMFSKRTAAITPAADALIRRFREETGREPSGRERTQLCERATLATRQGKIMGGETREGQIARWADEHAQKLGVELGEVARGLAEVQAGAAATWSERDVVSRALATMEVAKQSWTRSELMRAVSDALPGNLGVGPERVLPLLEGLTDKAETLVRHLNPQAGPEGLGDKYYRADGQSVFVRPGSERYATDTQLLGEYELRAAAVRRGAPAWTSEQADAVLDRFAQAGRRLGADQEAALRGILTSGAAVEVLAAPAGTGKSFLVGTLAETWPRTATPGGGPGGLPSPTGDPTDPTGGAEDAGEGPRVFGVAYGQRQADVLAEEGVAARNITRWLGGQANLDAGTASTADEAFRLRSGDLLVVDEAGAATTADLAAIHRRCEQAGAKLLLVGDAKQLAAVGAGGALTDIADRAITYELAEVRRFNHEWEGPASLRLRDGDTSVIGDYVKHGRLLDGGTVEQAEAKAARLWLDATIEGREALLVVGSNQAAARTAQALRADLVRLGRVEETGVRLGMAGWEGTVAGVGDLVQARRNAWHLAGCDGNTEAPINRSTYRVTALHPDNRGLTVARVTGRDTDGVEQLADPLQLPGSYVGQHLTLAYASTVHAAHGRTVDDGISVLGPGTDAAAAYTQLTRGRGDNVAVMVTRRVAEGADTGETHTVAPRGAADVLADIIRPPEQDPNRTALAQAEDHDARRQATGTHVDPMLEVLADTMAGRTQRWLDQLAADGSLPEQHRLALAADEARGTLDPLLRSAELAGHDPEKVLREAVTERGLDGSASVAQVVHFRIRAGLHDQLTPQVCSYADLLPRDLPEHSRAGLHALAAAADARRTELGEQLAQRAPQWAREALGPVPDDPAGRDAWIDSAGWAASYRELVAHDDDADPLGASPPAGLAEKHAVFRTAHQALDLADVGADEEQASEGRLRAWIAAYEAEKTWAPRYVADELDATHDALRQHRADATIWDARADAHPDPAEAEQLRAAAAQARDDAQRLAGQVEQLQQADAARTAWWLSTVVTRDRSERGRVVLGSRGIDIDAPQERVTAQEWLDADLADRLAGDPDREIREDYELHDTPQRVRTSETNDVDGARVDEPTRVDHDEPHAQDDRDQDERDPGEPDHDEEAAAPDPAATADRADEADEDAAARGAERDEPLAETRVPDLRETSVPDATESQDPGQRRRVPPVDDTTATVDRAHLATVEIANRETIDEAAAREHDPDDERRDEIHRWSDDDEHQAAEPARAPDRASDQEDAFDDDVLER